MYITQVLGVALGLTFKEVMLDRLFVPLKNSSRSKVNSHNNHKGRLN